MHLPTYGTLLIPLDVFEQIFRIYFHEEGPDVIYTNFVISSNYRSEC